MSYEVTSPNGSLRYHAWSCDRWRCTGVGGGLGADRDKIRKAAVDHVRESGHDVTVIDGTSESLMALATTTEGAVAP